MRILLILICLSFNLNAFAQKAGATQATSGKFDFNYYRDTRAYNVMTINLLADFAEKFQYFSLVDYFSEMESPESTDADRFYTEQNLRYYLSKDKFLALSTQAAMGSGPRNDLFRTGLLINVNSAFPWKDFFGRNNMAFAINLFPVQLDYLAGYSWQIEYIYSVLIAPTTFNERLYLAGFADQNMHNGEITWVTEHQLGFRIYDNFFAVTEYRINESFEEETGFGIGLEYLLPF